MLKGLVVFLLLLLVIGWIVLSPGVYTVPPSLEWPEGVTIVYVNKSGGVPFFFSPDAYCYDQSGYVSDSCRSQSMRASAELVQRQFFRLPYSEWAYARAIE